MRERRYQPNRAARSLVAGRSFTIGLIVPDLKQPFLAEIAKANASRIRALDYSLIIASSEEDPAIEQREVEGLIARQVDAIVLASEQTSADGVVIQRLAELQIPYVLVDRNFPGLDVNYVGVDDAAVGRAATEHIIACGRAAQRRIPPSWQVSSVMGISQLIDTTPLIRNHTFGTGPQFPRGSSRRNSRRFIYATVFHKC